MYKKFIIYTFAWLMLMVGVGIYAAGDEFENPLVLEASEVVPKDLLESELYSIKNEVITRGYTNTYQITSTYGDFTVHGYEMLLQRIQEIKAIDELAKIKSSNSFKEGIKTGAKMPFSFVKNLVTHPVDTVTGIPKGLWRYGSRVGEAAGSDKSEYEDNFGKELILFSAQKRKLAYDLNVDVYSSNKILQEYLNSVSWASYSGGIVVTAALTPLRVIRLTKTAQNVNNLIRDNAPEDLRKINRKKLKALDVPGDVIEAFLDSRWFSPRHETTIVHALEYQGLKGGISDYIQLATTAQSEEDAFFFQNIIELTLHYLSNTVESDTSIVVHDNFALLRVRKHFVFPILVDNGYWSEFGARLINKFESELRAEHGQGVQILLWITGEVSERAKKELAARNILIVENAYTTLGKDI